MLEEVSTDSAKPRQPAYVTEVQIWLMAESVALMVLFLTSFLVWLLLDSDDDNGGGGLRQPVLIPIPVRDQRR